jgi:DNA-binding CsgD family transcriptional regulator
VLRLLTRREREVLVLVCAGYSNRKIGERVLIVDQAVKNRLRYIYKKAGVKNRHELVVFCWQHGIVQCPCQSRRVFIGGHQADALVPGGSPAPKQQQHAEAPV